MVPFFTFSDVCAVHFETYFALVLFSFLFGKIFQSPGQNNSNSRIKKLKKKNHLRGEFAHRTCGVGAAAAAAAAAAAKGLVLVLFLLVVDVAAAPVVVGGGGWCGGPASVCSLNISVVCMRNSHLLLHFVAYITNCSRE